MTQIEDSQILGLHPTIPASVFAIFLLILLAFVPEVQRIQIIGYQLFVIAAVYLGFAINDGRTSVLLIETLQLAFFFVVGVLGLWISPWFLVAGYIMHGVWDILHNQGGLDTRLAEWYPFACMVYDWLFALVLILWLLV